MDLRWTHQPKLPVFAGQLGWNVDYWGANAMKQPTDSQHYFLRPFGLAFVDDRAFPKNVDPTEVESLEPSAVIAEMLELFNDSDTISEIIYAPNDIPTGWQVPILTSSAEGFSPQLSDAFVLRFRYPRKNQHLPSGYEGLILEDFEVVYNGTAGCVIGRYDGGWSINDNLPSEPYGVFLMHHVTKCLSDALRKSPTRKPVALFPEIRDVWFSLEVKTGSELSELQFWKDLVTVYAEISVPAEEVANAARSVAETLSFEISDLYEAIQLRNRVNLLTKAMHAEVEHLGELYSRLSSIAWWQVWRISRFGMSREMRTSISDLFQKYIFLTRYEIDVDEAKKFLFDHFDSKTAIYHARDVMDLHLGPRMQANPAAILEAIRFYEEEGRSALSLDTIVLITLTAALVSGSVAGIFELAK
jgi:hypothetical protein